MLYFADYGDAYIYIIHQLTHYLLHPWVRWDNAISFLSNDKTSLWKPLTIHYIRHNTTKMPPLGSVIDSLRLLFYIFICFVCSVIYIHSIIHRFFFSVKDAWVNLTSNEDCLFYLIHNRSVWSSINLTTERNTSNGCEGSIETNVSSSSSSYLQQEAKEAKEVY